MKKTLILFSLCGALTAVRAEESPQTQIAALGAAYVEAFNKGDAKAVAGFWAPEGDYVDQFGNRYEGRAAIEKLFTEFFAANKGAQLRIDSESLKASGELAREDGTSAVLLPGEPLPSRARFSNVLVREDGKWQIVSVRESGLAPATRAKELAPLAWLIGPWQATVKSGETVFLSVAPAPGGNFLVINRTVVAGGGPVSGGTEWVAWDPTAGQIRSWSFDQDGGFGSSLWKPQDKSWTIESTHTLRDGNTMREIQSIAPDGKGGVVVKTLGLSSADKDLPKPEDITFVRPQSK